MKNKYKPRLFPQWVYALRDAAALVFVIIVILYLAVPSLEAMLAN